MAKYLLVIEDVPPTQAVLTSLSLSFGYEVHSTTNLAGALSRLTTRTFDGIILDLLSTKETGLDLLATIKAQYQSIPIIAISNYPQEVTRAVSHGVDFYLTKPFEPALFKQLLYRYIPVDEGRLPFN